MTPLLQFAISRWEGGALADDPERADFAFEIQGPDDDGYVWICSDKGREVWCRNLGKSDDAAEVMCQWLGSIDYGECS